MDLSKCDFSTDNGNYNKDTKPLWCDFFLDSEVQSNQKLHSVRGLKKLNRKFTYTNFVLILQVILSTIHIWYLVIQHTAKNIIWKFMGSVSI